jgi:hypothetical protein
MDSIVAFIAGAHACRTLCRRHVRAFLRAMWSLPAVKGPVGGDQSEGAQSPLHLGGWTQSAGLCQRGAT